MFQNNYIEKCETIFKTIKKGFAYFLSLKSRLKYYIQLQVISKLIMHRHNATSGDVV